MLAADLQLEMVDEDRVLHAMRARRWPFGMIFETKALASQLVGASRCCSPSSLVHASSRLRGLLSLGLFCHLIEQYPAAEVICGTYTVLLESKAMQRPKLVVLVVDKESRKQVSRL